MRRTYLIATLVLGLTATAMRTSPAYGRFVVSAHNFQQYYHQLKGSDGAVTSWQRFFFSLVLANGEPERHSPAVQHHS